MSAVSPPVDWKKADTRIGILFVVPFAIAALLFMVYPVVEAVRLSFFEHNPLRPEASEFSFGFPRGAAYACMSETMMLALEGRYESFTLGKEVSVEQAEEMLRLADKHGFALGGFRSFEKEVTPETIAAVRKAAGRDAAPKASAVAEPACA